MNYLTKILLGLLCLVLTTNLNLIGQDHSAPGHKCGITEKLEEAQKDPAYFDNLKAFQSKVDEIIRKGELIKNNVTDPCPNGITIIPIAFQLFHEPTAAIGQGHNFSNTDLNKAVDYLNMHYSGYDPRKEVLNDDYVNFDAGHTCIQFTIGKINRIPTNTCLSWKENATHYVLNQCLPGGSGLGSENSPSDYLNIYSSELIGGLLGQASCIPGIFGNCNSTSDGVTIDWDILIPGASNNSNFNRGGILAHEVGHWLGLPHVDGDIAGSGCGADDGIKDTYPQAKMRTYICSQSIPNSCETPDNVFNFMDYGMDCAKVMFTKQQAYIMQDVLNSTRVDLVSSYERLQLENKHYDLSQMSREGTYFEMDTVSCYDQINLLAYQEKWTMSEESGIGHSGLENFFWERKITGIGSYTAKIMNSAHLSRMNALTDADVIKETSIVIYKLKSKVWSPSKGSYNRPSTVGMLVMRVEPCSTPVNDRVASAIELTQGTLCSDQTFSLYGAHAETSSPDQTYEKKDVWFTIANRDIDDQMTLLVKRAFSGVKDPLVEIFTERFAPLEVTRKDSVNGAYYTVNGISGNEMLYVRVYDELLPVADPFQICRIYGEFFTNDECQYAVEIPVSEECNWLGYTFEGATPSLNIDTDYNCGTKAESNDVWFNVTVPNSGAMAVKTRNKAGYRNNLLVEVYSGACGQIELIACQMVYTTSANPFESYIPVIDRVPGEELIIRVGANGYSEAGEFEICVSEILENRCSITKIELDAEYDCDTINNTYTQEILVHYNTAEENTTLVLNGKYYDLVNSPQRIVLEDVPTNDITWAINARLINSVTPSCGKDSRYVIREAAYQKSSCYNNGSGSSDFRFTEVDEDVAEEELNIAVLAYPNPTTDLLNISIDAESNLTSTVTIVDNFGKAVYTSDQVESDLQVQVADYPDGIYHIMVQNGDSQKSTRIIKS